MLPGAIKDVELYDTNQTHFLPLFSAMASQVTPIKPHIYTREHHCVSRSNLDEDALKIMYRLVRHGYKAYLVGGGVRDLLLSKKPKDYDIATDATPRQIKDLFRNSRVIGRRFKLVHVFFGGGKIIQVSTFRDFSDPVETDPEDDHNGSHRAPATDNKYGTEITDAQRRDLTINGLFYDVSSFSIIDYVGGMKDLQDKIIRIIGDPDERFIEDPVRLIRVVRHAARSGFEIEHNCWEAIGRRRELLLTCSTMRVFEEVKKDLLSGSCLPIFQLLNKARLLELLLPEISGAHGHLLQDGEQFAKCLEKLDTLVKDGKTLSVAAILGVVAIYAFADAPLDHTRSRFDDVAIIPAFVRNCFAKLAVPKREREKIEEVLHIYHDLLTRGEAVRVGSLARRAVFQELRQFFDLLNIGGAYDTIVIRLDPKNHVVDDGVDEDPPASPSDGNGYPSRGRRRRRRGGRGRSRRGAPREEVGA